MESLYPPLLNIIQNYIPDRVCMDDYIFNILIRATARRIILESGDNTIYELLDFKSDELILAIYDELLNYNKEYWVKNWYFDQYKTKLDEYEKITNAKQIIKLENINLKGIDAIIQSYLPERICMDIMIYDYLINKAVESALVEDEKIKDDRTIIEVANSDNVDFMIDIFDKLYDLNEKLDVIYFYIPLQYANLILERYGDKIHDVDFFLYVNEPEELEEMQEKVRLFDEYKSRIK